MIDEFKKICEVKENVNLKDYLTFKIENYAKLMIFPSNIDELKESLQIIKNNKLKYFVIGNGSNIIVPSYYDGVIINLKKLNHYEIKDDILYVEAGMMLNKLSNKVSNMGYKGLEWACGIPGSIGGSIVGNAGSFKSSISEVLISATLFNGKKIIEMSNEELKFQYRDSILKHKKNLIVLSCKIKLEKYDANELKKIILENNQKRVSTQDLINPSNGSVFRNPEGYSAGKLIDDLGFKGYKINDAMVSLKHANFIVNTGNAKSEDIIKLIKKVKKEVKKQYNIDLVLEQEIIK